MDLTLKEYQKQAGHLLKFYYYRDQIKTQQNFYDHFDGIDWRTKEGWKKACQVLKHQCHYSALINDYCQYKGLRVQAFDLSTNQDTLNHYGEFCTIRVALGGELQHVGAIDYEYGSDLWLFYRSRAEDPEMCESLKSLLLYIDKQPLNDPFGNKKRIWSAKRTSE